MISQIPPSICIDHVTYRNSILLGVGEKLGQDLRIFI